MMRLSVVMLMAVILSVNGYQQAQQTETISVQVMSGNNFYQWLCQQYVSLQTWSICQNYTATTTAATSTMAMTSQAAVQTNSQSTTSTPFMLETTTTGTTGANVVSTTTSATPLQTAHWCRFNNGSYLSLGATYMNTVCDICQCTQSRAIRCVTLVCKTTYCIDDSTPSTKAGQCCSQCAYENNTNTCVVSGITYPQGQFQS
jgi:hypothetical protein